MLKRFANLANNNLSLRQCSFICFRGVVFSGLHVWALVFYFLKRILTVSEFGNITVYCDFEGSNGF